MSPDQLKEELLAELHAFSNTWWANEFASPRDLWNALRVVMIKHAEWQVAAGVRASMPDLEIR